MDDLTISDPHKLSATEVLAGLDSTLHGLAEQEVISRQQLYGLNTLPHSKATGVWLIFLRQFLNPLIYILLLAALIAVAVGKYSDTAFIIVVLLLNAVIGAFQEYAAQKSAAALNKMVTHIARVIRNGTAYELEAEQLVPGDIVLVESGDKIPADLRLLRQHELAIDESLLTGESLAVQKQADRVMPEDTVLADRLNMAHAGTLVTRGRATGVVTATGLRTQLGLIAEGILSGETTKPPLIIRMERFTNRIGIWMSGVILVIAIVSLGRGMGFTEVMMMAIALAVAAIPEGLPVAMTVALSISMRRMAKRQVIVRRLVTVESLGSCTYIATDKTGTLTANELTIQNLILPDGKCFQISGIGSIPEGHVESIDNTPIATDQQQQIRQLTEAAMFANEAFLGKKDGSWAHHGDAVDVAFLVLGHKLGLDRPVLLEQMPEIDAIPYESNNMFAASLHGRSDGHHQIYLKGAVEKVLGMCDTMQIKGNSVAIDITAIEDQARQLAEQGFRVLAVATGETQATSIHPTPAEPLSLLGLAGIIDPLRETSPQAIRDCRDAGIQVAMLTGDHPVTALAIARQLQMAETADDVTSGGDLITLDDSQLDKLSLDKHVFARIEPQQKTAIVRSLQRNGHFVAVTGDGANDAPALSAAHIGVAMGKTGTDVARETADMILADDDFSSIVAGIEEGRIAYANIRKVIFLLISTGAAEIVLFILSLLSGLPLPLTAIQLLWLNLVTNGIQDIALAFEPGEGDELKRSPRPPKEAIFNKIMLQRVLLSALVMGSLAYASFYYLLSTGMDIVPARNLVLLLMVLFENIHVFNSRSETRSVFSMRLFSNPLLVFGTIAAQSLHIASMYIDGLNDILQTMPVSLMQWASLLLIGMTLLLVHELYKWTNATRISN